MLLLGASNSSLVASAADGAMRGIAAAQCAVSRTPTTTRATRAAVALDKPMVLLSTAKTSATVAARQALI